MIAVLDADGSVLLVLPDDADPANYGLPGAATRPATPEEMPPVPGSEPTPSLAPAQALALLLVAKGLLTEGEANRALAGLPPEAP